MPRATPPPRPRRAPRRCWNSGCGSRSSRGSCATSSPMSCSPTASSTRTRTTSRPGASATLSHSAAPEGRSLAWTPARNLGGLQLVWEGWDLGLEYAGAAPRAAVSSTEPSHLAGFSTHGDPLGSAFGREATTRTLEVGLPLFLEGQGRIRFVRATAPLDHPSGAASWFLQGEAQWRTRHAAQRPAWCADPLGLDLRRLPGLPGVLNQAFARL